MSVFGPIVSPWDVEQGVIALLQNPPPGGSAPRLVYYLAEYERQHSLAPETLKTPPGPSSYRGGVDAFTLEAEWFPMLHVIAEPDGPPERTITPGTYVQRYDVHVVATVGNDNEDTARMAATAYGAAVMAAVVQHPSLGIGANTTVIKSMPDSELLDPDNVRQVVRSTVTFSTLIGPVVIANGPTVWPLNPYASPGDWPEVETVDVQVIAESLD